MALANRPGNFFSLSVASRIAYDAFETFRRWNRSFSRRNRDQQLPGGGRPFFFRHDQLRRAQFRTRLAARKAAALFPGRRNEGLLRRASRPEWRHAPPTAVLGRTENRAGRVGRGPLIRLSSPPGQSSAHHQQVSYQRSNHLLGHGQRNPQPGIDPREKLPDLQRLRPRLWRQQYGARLEPVRLPGWVAWVAQCGASRGSARGGKMCFAANEGGGCIGAKDKQGFSVVC